MRRSEIPCFPLRPTRVHEAMGPLAAGFAAICIAEARGPAFWVRESWRTEALHPGGASAFFDPARLLLGQVRNQAEALAVTEEALRDGGVPLVVTELGAPLSLTEARRLQLAALAGKSTGLCLCPDGMGSNAAETRWHCAPLPDPEGDPSDSTLQCWRLIKNKSGTLGAWHVRWHYAARRLAVVSAACE